MEIPANNGAYVDPFFPKTGMFSKLIVARKVKEEQKKRPGLFRLLLKTSAVNAELMRKYPESLKHICELGSLTLEQKKQLLRALYKCKITSYDTGGSVRLSIDFYKNYHKLPEHLKKTVEVPEIHCVSMGEDVQYHFMNLLSRAVLLRSWKEEIRNRKIKEGI